METTFRLRAGPLPETDSAEAAPLFRVLWERVGRDADDARPLLGPAARHHCIRQKQIGPPVGGPIQFKLKAD